MFLENTAFKTNATCSDGGKASDGFLQDVLTCMTASMQKNAERIVSTVARYHVMVVSAVCTCSVIRRTQQDYDITYLMGVLTCSGTPPSRSDTRVAEESSIVEDLPVVSW